jgi:hypothetical protein
MSFYSVPEFQKILGKSRSRMYQIIREGLLQEAGLTVVRTEKGRLWISCPEAAFFSSLPTPGKR